MKAQILKLAGVKTEAEFYKKFPTEEAFMKKHGKALKKAQVGAIIGEGDEQKPIKPLNYQKTMSNSLQSFGIDSKDPVFQNVINPQAKKTGFEKFAPLIGEGIESLAPQINEAMGVGKNGKKLKKAQTGFEGLIKPPAMPKVDAVNLGKTEGFGLSKMEDIPASTQRGFDYGKAFKKMPGALASQAGTIVGGIQEIQQNKRNLKKQQMYGKVSDVVLQASKSRPEQTQRRYVRPEDQSMSTQNPLGTGTNYLAQNGAMVGGNPTEIQNMYNPGDMYTDLGYEPLNDSNVKQYAHGGRLRKAQGGFSLDSLAGVGGGLGGMLGSQIGGGGGEVGPGSKIGSAVGGVLGMAIPIPGVGSFIGSTLGGLAGGLFDAPGQKKRKAAEEKLQNNLMASNFQAGAANFQGQNSAFMEDGGYVSNDWTPQVITKFGDLDVSEVHTFAADGMPKYRAGGHLREYTPPSASAMYTGRDLPYQMEDGGQMARGGDLEVHRGEAEPMSYNPYLPSGGETIMFRGPSHDNGGMPVSFGNNGVEVEGGEPAIKMKDGGESESLVVLGNMKIPKYGVTEIGDNKAKGKKFKHYFADLSKQEVKQNTILDKSATLANDADANDPFDRLSIASAQAMQMGANMKLKNIAKKKLDTVAVQNAILDTAKEYGVKSDDLAKGKIVKAKANDPYAKNGKTISKAQGGINLAPIVEALPSSYIPNLYKQIQQAIDLQNAMNTTELDNVTVVAPRLDKKLPSLPLKQSAVNMPLPELQRINLASSEEEYDTDSKTKKSEGLDWMNIGKSALMSASPFLRTNLGEPLDPAQLAPEMMAMNMNQLEPVQAQSFNPLLTQPFRVSLQDQRNEVTAASRAAERMAAYNPAAASMIFAQAADAKNKINAEEFRMNQAEQARSAEQNRAILNDAQLKNLAIFDQQYVRQSEARSKTKQQAIEISKSIADKMAQNKLQNRTLSVYQNMFPGFSFTPEGTAYKNPLQTAFFNPGTVGGIRSESGSDSGVSKDAIAAAKALAKLTAGSKEEKRNGAIVKAIKNL
jgi:hypothetical protein